VSVYHHATWQLTIKTRGGDNSFFMACHVSCTDTVLTPI